MKNKEMEEKNRKRVELAKNFSLKLKDKLSSSGMSQSNFFEEVYKLIDPNADYIDIFDHGTRAKKNLSRNSEVSALYLFFYENKYEKFSVINEHCRNAAYELYVEISTRISSTKLPEGLGCDSAALDSVYSLFNSWRIICKQHGVNGIVFLDHSKVFFNEIIRPFTTKWHNNLPSSGLNSDFRSELLEVQKSTEVYIAKLLIDFKSYPQTS